MIKSTWWIPGNTPSSKNSKVWTGNFLVPSKTTQRWVKATKKLFDELAMEFRVMTEDLPRPLYIEFTFVRDSRRKFDYNNISQSVLDMMKEHGWIDDDNCDEVKPYFGDYKYDKHNPGVLITILQAKPQHY